MQIKDKVIIVTGGASGIGKEMCIRFAKEGAKGICVADIDFEGAKKVAEEVRGLPVACDVRKEEDILLAVKLTEEKLGPIDMFCSNAGIAIFGGLEVEDSQWQKIWEINVRAHIYAARAVVPGMISRGGGYLLNTASAAGLLSQIGSAPYSVTKHAAVGLAENLAITYGDQGIKVSVICPQAVDTPMSNMVADGGVAGVDGMMSPGQVVDAVLLGLEEERFLILPHQEVQTYMERKVSDYDRWLKGMRKLQKRYMETPS
ncbi:MAG: SDR family oxidoreductase [Desulfobacteraceae bacterium]|nr:SDR family oxidoreductase [Desulfobacteraceae bacterium]MBU4052724.1 SDR family oxidoreductase [Pseudomonadota bacterium]